MGAVTDSAGHSGRVPGGSPDQVAMEAPRGERSHKNEHCYKINGDFLPACSQPSLQRERAARRRER